MWFWLTLSAINKEAVSVYGEVAGFITRYTLNDTKDVNRKTLCSTVYTKFAIDHKFQSASENTCALFSMLWILRITKQYYTSSTLYIKYGTAKSISQSKRRRRNGHTDMIHILKHQTWQQLIMFFEVIMSITGSFTCMSIWPMDSTYPCLYSLYNNSNSTDANYYPCPN